MRLQLQAADVPVCCDAAVDTLSAGRGCVVEKHTEGDVCFFSVPLHRCLTQVRSCRFSLSAVHYCMIFQTHYVLRVIMFF